MTTVVMAMALLGPAASASADHHFMKIREFYPGTAANPNTRGDAFIELQMYAGGQNFIGGHHIDVYGPTTDMTADTYTFSSTPALNGGDQRTILAGGPDVAGRDRSENIGASVNPAGGAICFRSNTLGLIDCAEWGSGNDTVNEGTPVSPGGITDGKSIERTLAFGCETLLQQIDDNSNSSSDFSEQTPSPRNNATAPTESNCVLTVSVAGSGTVTGTGINCPPTCTAAYFNGEFFGLTAMPVAGGMLNMWTACPGSIMGNQCQGVDMSQSRTAGADFAVVTPPPSDPSPPATTPTSISPTTTAPAAKKCKKGFVRRKGKCRKKRK